MRHLLARVATIMVVLCGGALAVPSAALSHQKVYINGELWFWYTANCYYANSEACSGWSTWDYNIVQTGHSSAGGVHDMGYILAGFDTNSVIRGVRMYAHTDARYITTAQLNMPDYARAMSLLWTADSMYVTGVACTHPDC